MPDVPDAQITGIFGKLKEILDAVTGLPSDIARVFRTVKELRDDIRSIRESLDKVEVFMDAFKKALPD